MNITPKLVLAFLAAVLVIMASFTLLGWLFSFTGLFFAGSLFSDANPIGTAGVLLALVVGGFYLFKIGFSVLKNLL